MSKNEEKEKGRIKKKTWLHPLLYEVIGLQ